MRYPEKPAVTEEMRELVTQTFFSLAPDPIDDLIEILTGIEDGDPDDLGTWITQIRTLLSGGTVTSPVPSLAGVSSIEDAIGAIAASFTDLWAAFNGTYSGSDTNLTNLSGWAADRVDDIGGIVSGIFNGWFGSGATGSVAEVQTTIEAVKDAVINGYTVQTFTSSGTWTKPAGITELVVIAVGGGRNGAGGVANTSAVNGDTAAGGAGGDGGNYVAMAIDPSAVASTVAVTVATAGGTSSFGPHLSVSHLTGSGIASQFGFSPTTSAPGAGGNGGSVVQGSVAEAGTAGTASALGAAGAGGAGGSGAGTSSAGAAGGSVSGATTTKCGGGGAGGGGGRYITFTGQNVNGGAGGAGGYPGGGGGGGGALTRGAVASGSPGAGGAGAAGVVWIFYR